MPRCRPDIRAQLTGSFTDVDHRKGSTAHSGDPERSIRSIMNTESGDREHLLAAA
jgi:hypothetical protein